MPAAIQSLHDLAAAAASNPALQQELKDDPAGTLHTIAQTAGLPNTGVYKLVVGALGITVLLALMAAFVLALRVPAGTPVETPAILTALGSAAMGALAGILAPVPKQ